ncbi:MAG: Ig domain-containing protein [Eubacterium sp.]|nr:Ig domain-containing protein [Eubacterium sp.]
MKNRIKKLISLILMLSMVCGLVVTSFAAEPDFTVKLYKADGSEIASEDSVKEGETITAKLFAEKDLTYNSAQFYLWFDAQAFSYGTGELSTAVKSEFSMKSVNLPASTDDYTEEEKARVNAGNATVWITLSNFGTDVALPKGEIASLTFTALNAVDNAVFEAQIKQMLHTVDGDSETEVTDLTAGSASVTVKPSTVAVSSITLSASELSVDIGKTATLTATVLPEDATDKTIIWTSSDESVATVNSSGVVTGVKAGSATITAASGIVSAVCAVVVKNPVTKITLSAPVTSIKVGGTVQISVTYEPVNADEDTKILTWEAANTASANLISVDSNGVVTGIAPGDATVRARTANKKTATIKIKVIEPVEGNYTVTMPEDVDGIAVGGSVLIPVSIGNKDESVTSYNAYRVVIDYDDTALKFETGTSTSSSGQFAVSEESGQLIVSDYGETKTTGEAFTLKFTAIGQGGETTLTAKEAQVDIGENAVSANAPEASFVDADTVISIKQMYTVTLPDDYTTQMSTVVEENGTITFSIKGYDSNYNYTVSATMGGESVNVVDNQDGTYTISSITGNVVVNAPKKTGKSLAVSLPEEYPEVTGEATAIYGTPYTFSVNEEDGYTYNVSVTIGGTPYTTLEAENGSYTIPGDAVTGDIVVSVSKEEKPVVYSVTVGEGAEGSTTATKGVDYTFMVKEAEDYTWKVKITIGGEEYTGYTVSGNTYTIPGKDVLGEIVIETTMGNKIFNVHFLQVNSPANQMVTYRSDTITKNVTAVEVSDTAENGLNYNFIIGYKTGYAYDLVVKMGGEVVTPKASIDYVPTSSAQTITYTIEGVTGDIEITLTRHFYGEVKITEYVQLDGKTVYLVMASEYIQQNQPLWFTNDAGQVVMMNATNRYQSKVTTENRVWTYLIIADGSFDKEAFINNFMNTAYRATGAAAISDSCDVNGSGLIDINDAQLTYDIYTGKYDSFDSVSMKKMLQADVNADTKVDVADAAAVVNAIP